MTENHRETPEKYLKAVLTNSNIIVRKLWTLNENATLKHTHCRGEKPQQTTQVHTSRKWTEQAWILTGLPWRSYQLQCALSKSFVSVTHFSKSDSFFLLWLIFNGLTHFYICKPFVREWSIFTSLTIFLRVTYFTKCDSFFQMCLIFPN